jgi:hypothetical protein
MNLHIDYNTLASSNQRAGPPAEKDFVSRFCRLLIHDKPGVAMASTFEHHGKCCCRGGQTFGGAFPEPQK